MKQQKKAQIDVQFNWIFILIVGAIILSFFVGVAFWYKGTQEQKMTGEVITGIDAVFKTAKESPNTARTTTIPSTELHFSCDESECSSLGCPSSFSSGPFSRATETEILFSHETLAGTTLITWALEWKLPYKIADFLFVTSDTVRYVLLTDSGHSAFAYSINSMLSDNSFLTKELIFVDSDFTIEDKNDAFVRFISFAPQGTFQEENIVAALGEQGESWDILYVAGTEEQGEIAFTDGTVSYIGLPSLLGALFSVDAAFYTCNMHKAGIQAGLISSLYQKRTALFYDTFQADPEMEYCQYYYDPTVQDYFDTIALEIEEQNFQSTALADAIVNLEENNEYAIIKGCPRVY